MIANRTLSARAVSAPRPIAPPERRLHRQWEVGLLLGLVILCLGMRLVNLGALPIFIDEADSALAAKVVSAAPSTATWLVSMNFGVYPLFPWIGALLARFIDDPLTAVRIAAAVAGTAGLVPVWATGRTLWGPRAGALAALLYALCPFAVFYNRLAVPDGLVATCSAGALFFAIRLAREGRLQDASALGLCLAAGLLTKIFAVSMLLLPLLAVVAAAPSIRRAAWRGALWSALLGVSALLWLFLTADSTEHHTQVQERVAALVAVPGIIANQFQVVVHGLWLYVTPSVIVLAAIGLMSIRRERVALLLGPWALLSALPRILAPVTYITPRHFVYAAIPILILAARGLLVLIAGSARSPGSLLRWAATGSVMSLALVFAAALDATIVLRPDRTPMNAFDRWQYVNGWPSGYALQRIVSYVRRSEAHGPVTVLAPLSNPVVVTLGHDHRFTLAPGYLPILRTELLHVDRTGSEFLITCSWAKQPLIAHPHGLRLLMQAPNADGIGGYALYQVERRQ